MVVEYNIIATLQKFSHAYKSERKLPTCEREVNIWAYIFRLDNESNIECCRVLTDFLLPAIGRRGGRQLTRQW